MQPEGVYSFDGMCNLSLILRIFLFLYRVRIGEING